MMRLCRAIDSIDHNEVARLVVEEILETEPGEDVAGIAADFIENEVGRYDWAANWEVVKQKGDPVEKVREYLDRYDILADPEAVVDEIERMVVETPGTWR